DVFPSLPYLVADLHPVRNRQGHEERETKDSRPPRGGQRRLTGKVTGGDCPGRQNRTHNDERDGTRNPPGDPAHHGTVAPSSDKEYGTKINCAKFRPAAGAIGAATGKPEIGSVQLTARDSVHDRVIDEMAFLATCHTVWRAGSPSSPAVRARAWGGASHSLWRAKGRTSS